MTCSSDPALKTDNCLPCTAFVHPQARIRENESSDPWRSEQVRSPRHRTGVHRTNWRRNSYTVGQSHISQLARMVAHTHTHTHTQIIKKSHVVLASQLQRTHQLRYVHEKPPRSHSGLKYTVPLGEMCWKARFPDPLTSLRRKAAVQLKSHGTSFVYGLSMKICQVLDAAELGCDFHYFCMGSRACVIIRPSVV